MPLTPSTLVADIASRHPRSIDVFERHGIDFCCGGRRPLGEVCREKGIDPGALAAEIEKAAAAETASDRTWTDAPLGDLLDHVGGRYHSALREDLPRLGRMADKVAEVHGSRHVELVELATRLRELPSGFAVPEDGCSTYRALYEGLARFERELHEHVHLENNVVFPRVVSLAAHAPSAG